MSRFSSERAVREAAEYAAKNDLMQHKEHGADLNPYCTPHARDTWQRGFKGEGARSYENPSLIGWDFQYQRGAAMARLLEEN